MLGAATARSGSEVADSLTWKMTRDDALLFSRRPLTSALLGDDSADDSALC